MMSYPSEMQVSRNCRTVLPPEARALLVLAASDCRRIADPDERAKKIDAAIGEVRRKFPQFFVMESENAANHA